MSTRFRRKSPCTFERWRSALSAWCCLLSPRLPRSERRRLRSASTARCRSVQSDTTYRNPRGRSDYLTSPYLRLSASGKLVPDLSYSFYASGGFEKYPFRQDGDNTYASLGTSLTRKWGNLSLGGYYERNHAFDGIFGRFLYVSNDVGIYGRYSYANAADIVRLKPGIADLAAICRRPVGGQLHLLVQARRRAQDCREMVVDADATHPPPAFPWPAKMSAGWTRSIRSPPERATRSTNTSSFRPDSATTTGNRPRRAGLMTASVSASVSISATLLRSFRGRSRAKEQPT